jgi:hypothetical protein
VVGLHGPFTLIAAPPLLHLGKLRLNLKRWLSKNHDISGNCDGFQMTAKLLR